MDFLAGGFAGDRVALLETEGSSARVNTLQQISEVMYKTYVYHAVTDKIDEYLSRDKQKQSGWSITMLVCVGICSVEYLLYCNCLRAVPSNNWLCFGSLIDFVSSEGWAIWEDVRQLRLFCECLPRDEFVLFPYSAFAPRLHIFCLVLQRAFKGQPCFVVEHPSSLLNSCNGLPVFPRPFSEQWTNMFAFPSKHRRQISHAVAKGRTFTARPWQSFR